MRFLLVKMKNQGKKRELQLTTPQQSGKQRWMLICLKRIADHHSKSTTKGSEFYTPGRFKKHGWLPNKNLGVDVFFLSKMVILRLSHVGFRGGGYNLSPIIMVQWKKSGP